MIPRFGLPLAASLIGHGALLLVLVFLMAHLSPTPLPLRFPKGGIEVLLTAPPAPVPPAAPSVPQAEPPPPVLQTEPPPPPPPSPVIKPQIPAAPTPRHATPRTRISPPARQPPPTREPPEPPPRPVQPEPLPTPPLLAPSPATPALPPPKVPAAPVVSAGYRAALSGWLERHKQYPEGARARGEEGQAVLHFRVDRSGRVLGFSIVRGTGYPDLDAAIDRMMRGAVLPPFPADMTAAEIDVSVPLRFALSR